MALGVGANDGDNYGDTARIGNSVTLMNQRLNFNFKRRTGADDYNQLRLIIAESIDGNTVLALKDVLRYADYSTNGDMVFASPYTTKTDTNKRYKIKLDKVFSLTELNPAKVIKHNVKYGKTGKVVEFSSKSVVHPTNHCMNFFVISDSTAVQHP